MRSPSRRRRNGMFEYLGDTERGERGWTMVLDKGLGLNALEDLLAVGGSFIRLVKFGWGTSMLLDRDLLARKIEAIRARRLEVCPGGTFLELAYARGEVARFFSELRDLGFSSVEVSDGTVDISSRAKLDLIKRARDLGFNVLSEVGKKTLAEDMRLGFDERAQLVCRELAAGSEKVILEARESGSLGIFEPGGEVREELVTALADRLPVDRLLFEAPRKDQQVWLIRRFGPGVHLGNVPPDDVLSLETLRQGLRGDTLQDLLST